jgi:NADH dehydrogenase FAD-containing subunit
LLKRLRDAGVRMFTGAKVTEVDGRGVRMERAGSSEFVEADTVVNAGIAAVPKAEWQAAGDVAEVHIVGDGAEPGKLMEAVASGFIVGHGI